MKSTNPGQQHGIVDTDYYSFVDGLRGLAILMVLGVHSPGRELAADGVLSRLITAGARGVQLFFILSAFTLFSSSLQRFSRERNPRRNFYIRRAFRILPLWWLALLVFFVTQTWPPDDALGGAPSNGLNLLLHATFLFGFSPAYAGSLLPGGWSLFVEETFYIMLPFVQMRMRGLAQAARLTLALLGLSVAWYLPARALFGTGDQSTMTFVFTFPLCQWFIFGLGIVLFFLVKAAGPFLLKGPVAILADCAALIGLWAVFVGRPLGPVHFAAAFALLVFCFAVSQRDSLLRRVIDNPPIRLFGRCCYSIYLFHWLIVSNLHAQRTRVLSALGLGSADPEVRFAAWYVVLACACLAIGVASFYGFEKPMVVLGRRMVQRLEGKSLIPPGGNVPASVVGS